LIHAREWVVGWGGGGGFSCVCLNFIVLPINCTNVFLHFQSVPVNTGTNQHKSCCSNFELLVIMWAQYLWSLIISYTSWNVCYNLLFIWHYNFAYVYYDVAKAILGVNVNLKHHTTSYHRLKIDTWCKF